MAIPLLDLQAQHASIRDDIDTAIAAVLAHGRFVGGPEVGVFEEAFAAYCQADHCVGVSSGTAALTLALRAAGVQAGAEVITTPFTFIATAESIVAAGARPVFVDPDLGTALLQPDRVEAAIGRKTAAVVPVHLYGQPVDMVGFRDLADRHGLALVEDAAQAHGASWNGARVGSVGDAAAFSFFPGKNIGALGDAGAVTTRCCTTARQLHLLRDHGRVDKYRHEKMGTNARLDTLQAAVLSLKLAHLDTWNEARCRHAAAYDHAFADVDGVKPISVAEGAGPVYHQYVVRVRDRDGAVAHLRNQGIASGVHYPIPLHLQPALAGTGDAGQFPNAERLAQEVLSLPVYPELSEEQQGKVGAALLDHAARSSGSLARTAS